MRAERAEQRTRAQNQFLSQSKELQSKAAVDPDFSEKNRRFYQSEQTRIRSEASQLITLPADRSAFALNTELNNTVANINMQDSLRRTMIKTSKAQTELFHFNQKEIYIAGTDEEQKTALKMSAERDQSDVLIGLLLPAEAQLKDKVRRTEWPKLQFESDISLTDGMSENEKLIKLAKAEQNVLNNFYKFDAKEKNDALDVIKKTRNGVLKKEQFDREILMNRNSFKFTQMLTPDTTIAEMILFKAENPMKEKTFLNYIKDTQKGGNLFSEPDSKVMADLAISSVDLDKTLAQLQLDISKAKVDGKIDLKYVQKLERYLDKVFEGATKLRAPKNQFTKAVQGGMRALGRVAALTAGNPAPALSSMVETYITLIGDGKVTTPEEIQNATDKIILDHQKSINPNRTIFELGKTYDSPAGAFKVTGFDVDGEPMIIKVNK